MTACEPNKSMVAIITLAISLFTIHPFHLSLNNRQRNGTAAFGSPRGNELPTRRRLTTAEKTGFTCHLADRLEQIVGNGLVAALNAARAFW